MENIAEKLKGIIDNNGPEYLSEEPYKVYKTLVGENAVDKKIAGALLYLLTTEVLCSVKPGGEISFLSKAIQRECSFNKKMADQLATILLALYSKDNEKEWKDKDLAGLENFRKEKLTVKWEGFAIWSVSGGGVDCYYNADIVLTPAKNLVVNEDLKKQLRKNRFMKTEAIGSFYGKELGKYLDCEFEEYCTCDDYYQPVVEDFDLEYYVKDWCKENGFKIISCEGEGNDSGFEPDSVRRWIKY